MKIGNPISEKFRLVAKEYCELEAAANMLETTKTSVFSQMVLRLGDMAVNKAELIVRASPEWREHIEAIADARAKANLAKAKLEYVRMIHSEHMSAEANARAERKM